MHTGLLKLKFFVISGKKLLVMAATYLFFQTSFATSWFVNDGSLTGDVFTTAIGNNANAGTTAAPFATLSFAIGAATAGDTIYVDVGTYSDGDINVTKGLVIRGAKFGIPAGPAANAPGRGTNETIIAGGFGIYYGQSVDNITVDGFTIDLGTGIRGIESRGLNSVIINNIVNGTVNVAIQQAGISTRANGPLRLHSYLVRNNNVKNCRNGFFFDGNLENPSEFSYNYSSGCFVAGFQIVASNGHSFLGNVSENNGVGLTITEGNLIIERNTFNNNSVAGIRMAGTPELVGNNVQFNYFTNNFVGIALTDPNPGAINNQAHYNSFTGNATNIGNAHAADFNATCNWYGTASQPLIAATIVGPVTFVPFLNSGTDLDPVTEGFQPDVSSCLLPVTLGAFSATAKQYDVYLNWQTEQEVNSSHFEIQRSTDGRNFSYLGRVNAAGFSDNRRSYQFIDNKPIQFDRPVFYRLKIIDRDATFKYSAIVNVVLKNAGTLVQRVFPNPATASGNINIDVIASENEMINISLVNAIGQTTLQRSNAVVKGIHRLQVKVPVGASGVHYLLIRTAAGLQRIPVSIQ